MGKNWESFGFRQENFRLLNQYPNWTLVSVPYSETELRSHTTGNRQQKRIKICIEFVSVWLKSLKAMQACWEGRNLTISKQVWVGFKSCALVCLQLYSFASDYNLQVSGFQNKFMKSAFLPKYEHKNCQDFCPVVGGQKSWQQFLKTNLSVKEKVSKNQMHDSNLVSWFLSPLFTIATSAFHWPCTIIHLTCT